MGLVCAGVILVVVALLPAASGDNTADSELGQVDFVHSTVDFVRAQGFDLSASTPSPGIAVDSVNGCVYVADAGNNRVLGWHNEASFANGASADMWIGQHDQFSDQANTGGTTISTLSNPVGVTTDPAGNLYIADQGNKRVVEYSTPCLGFNPFTGNLSIPVNDPWGVAVDALGNLFVADRNNSRVLEFNTPLDNKSGEPGAGDGIADNIIGQTSGISCNQGQSAPSAQTLCTPYGVGIDAADNAVYVADTGNNRVVAFVPAGSGSSYTFGSNPSAVLVLGQRNFKSAAAGCGSGTTATSMCQPHGVALDPSRNAYVADTNNNRVLEFNAPAAYGGSAPEPATMIIGQDNPTANSANSGATVNANGLWQPAGVTTDAAGNLFVLDDHNFRALEFDETLPNPSNSTPNRELGQVDFDHSTVDFVDGSAFSNVSGVIIDRNSSPQHLYVVDSNNNRILGYKDATNFTDGASADLVIGQPDLFTTICNTNNVATSPPTASSLCLSSNPNADPEGADAAVDAQGNLWVSDVGNGRVLEFKAPFDSGMVAGEAASVVLGQPDFITGRSGPGCGPSNSSNFCEPAGLALDSNGDLYVADFGANRVLEFNQPANYTGAVPQPANLVIGQGSASNFTGNACNLGNGANSPTTDTLCKPIGVALDTQNNLYVADFNNSRVLEYDNPLSGAGTPGSPGASGDTTADLVFGQGATGGTSEFTTSTCNNGGISANSLCQPSGVTVDPFGSVYITDQANNRVLGYAEANNLPANVIAGIEFGQGTSGTVFNSNTRNLGGLSATSLNLAVISGQQDGIATDSAGDVFVVDAGNIRVLDFNGGFLSAPTPTPTITPTGSGTPTATPTETATATVTPSRTATPSPVAVRLTVTPKSLTFKKEVVIGLNGVTSAPKTLTLKTPKKGPGITITNFTTASPFAIDNSSVSNACTVQQVIAPGAKCEIGVTYTPTSPGKQTGSLVITDSGEVHRIPVSLMGTGVAGELTVKPATLNLKSVAVGTTSAPKTVTLTNKNALSMGLPGGISIAGADAAEFAETDTCGDVIPANGSCTVTITFTPTATGKQTADLTIGDVVPGGSQIVTLKGTGK